MHTDSQMTNQMDNPRDKHMTCEGATPLRVAYLLKRYPRLSETFILHEMLALEAQGVSLAVYSMLDPGEATVHPDVRRLRAAVTYLPATTLAHIAGLLNAHGRWLRCNPRRYLHALRFAVLRRDVAAGLRHFLRAGWLAYDLDRLGIRHLHAHFAHGPAATAQYVYLLSGIPYSFTGHAKDIYTTPTARIAARIREAAFVVTCTGFNATFLAQIVDAETARRIHRVYHGVDLTRFSPYIRHVDSDETAGIPTILAVGRLVEKKGLEYLIEACAQLCERGVRFRCQIVGVGPLKERLQAQIDARGLGEMVTFFGARTQDELVTLYGDATVMALPCVVLENGDRDGIPNVLVEAMSMELPVVSTRVSGIPELIEDGENGLLTPPRDADTLTDTLARLLGDAQLRQRLGQNARRTVMDRFELQRNARRLKMLFAHALCSTTPIAQDDEDGVSEDFVDDAMATMDARVQA